MNWHKRAILDRPYGGFPSGGGFNAYMEYEIGAQRIAEACHCIIGSCSRLHTSDYLTGETMHMEEEINIIKRVLDEYSKPIYIIQYIQPWRWDKDNNFPIMSLNSISDNSKKLLTLSKRKKTDFSDYKNREIFNIVQSSIDLLIILSNKMAESISLISEIINKWKLYVENNKSENEKIIFQLYKNFVVQNTTDFYKANKLGDEELKNKALEIDKNIKIFSESIKELEFWR